MAIKRVKKTEIKTESPVYKPEMESLMTDEIKKDSRNMNWLGWLGIVFAAFVFYWWKTNSWPIVAFAGGKPIFRSEVNRELFKQGGKNVMDNLVTEALVERELRMKGVRIDTKQVEAKLEEIKGNFPSSSDFETELKNRGYTLEEVKKQLELQLGIEKLLSERVEVTSSDTAKFIKEMGTLLTATTSAGKEAEAREILKNEKLQSEINAWIEELRNGGKVWWIGKV